MAVSARESTPQRIARVALVLFNAHGEPNVTTNHIADEAGISPGNLHYHFRSKEDLVMALFEGYAGRMNELVGGSDGEDFQPDIEDLWLFLHLLFETIGQYRFIYRDLTDLCGRYERLHRRFRRLSQQLLSAIHQACRGLIGRGLMQASDQELAGLARNITVVCTFWLAFDQVHDEARSGAVQDRPDRAAWLVMSLISPYLNTETRDQLNALAAQYQ
jgi:AcrR family transcriptional regulator